MLALLKDRHLQGEILSWLCDRDVCVVRELGLPDARARRDSAKISHLRQLDLMHPLRVSCCVVVYRSERCPGNEAAFPCRVLRELRNIVQLELVRRNIERFNLATAGVDADKVWDAVQQLPRLETLILGFWPWDNMLLIAQLQTLKELSLLVDETVTSYAGLRSLGNLRKLKLIAIGAGETRLIDLTDMSLEDCNLYGTQKLMVRLHGNPLRALTHDGDYCQSVSPQQLNEITYLSVRYVPPSCRNLKTLRLIDKSVSEVGRFSSLRVLEIFSWTEFGPVSSHCFDSLVCLEELTMAAIWAESRIDTMFDFSGLVSLTALCLQQTTPIDVHAIRNATIGRFQCTTLPVSGLSVLLANCGNLHDVQFGAFSDGPEIKAYTHILSIHDGVHPDMAAIKREITQRRRRLHA